MSKEVEVKKPQRWVYRFLMDTGFVIKKTTRESIRDAQGTLLDSVVSPPIKVNVVGNILVVNETMGKRFNIAPADIVKLLEAKPSFGKSFFCIESPNKVLTKQESESIDAMIKAKDKIPTGPEVITGARGLAR